MKKTVTVVCNLPKQSGITLRAPAAQFANDDPHYAAPEDLDLAHGINHNVSAAAVAQWATRLKDHVRFDRVGDLVVVSADDADLSVSVGQSAPVDFAAGRRAIERERIAIERDRIALLREELASSGAPRPTRAADARPARTTLQRALVRIDNIFRRHPSE